MSETRWSHTWCPQCGPDVAIDQDGCCVSCGCDAVGDGAEQVASLRSQLQAARAERDEAVAERDAARAERDRWRNECKVRLLERTEITNELLATRTERDAERVQHDTTREWGALLAKERDAANAEVERLRGALERIYTLAHHAAACELWSDAESPPRCDDDSCPTAIAALALEGAALQPHGREEASNG